VTAIAGQLGRPWREHQVLAGRTPGLFHLLLTADDATPR
jgi:hypothetical protein